MSFYLEAFFELSTDRRGPLYPIPWMAMDRYAERHGMTGVYLVQFQDIVRSLDRKYLSEAQSDG